VAGGTRHRSRRCSRTATPERNENGYCYPESGDGSLIGSDKVEGTAVYGADEQRIGTIQRVMIDKISGKVTYAVTSFGGFLGIGEDYYPLPWPTLKYDTRLGGYRTGLTADRLRGAPKYNRANDWDWNDRARDRQVYDYYNEPLWY
jgi:PRC-barrel domain